jgi:chromosome segregation ATPase
MNNIQKKEKNLIILLDKLTATTASYSQTNFDREKIEVEKNQLYLEKQEILTKNQELLREHKFLKEKIKVLQNELNNKIQVNQKFEKEIDELSQETESLAEEIDKWQM